MKLSIAIATWNRAGLLRQMLDSITALRIPGDVELEVLVCDNNSTDETAAVVQQFADGVDANKQLHSQVKVRYLLEREQGKSHALNLLVTEANGDWLLFVDDDVLLDPGWLEGYVDGAKQYADAGCLSGVVDPWLESEPTRRQRMLLDLFPEVFGVNRFEQDQPMDAEKPHVGGANMALLRSAIPDGGYDTELGLVGKERLNGEDVEIVREMLKAGGGGWMLADAKVRHYIPAGRIRARFVRMWQVAIGRNWRRSRGRPEPGRFGVAWWAWREMIRRAVRAIVRWRPWPTEAYYKSMVEAAQYWGYLRG